MGSGVAVGGAGVGVGAVGVGVWRGPNGVLQAVSPTIRKHGSKILRKPPKERLVCERLLGTSEVKWFL